MGRVTGVESEWNSLLVNVDPPLIMTQTSQMIRRTALVTGVTGQDGTYLSEFLLARGYDVWGLIRESSAEKLPQEPLFLSGSTAVDRIQFVTGDLADSRRLCEILQEIQPQEIYHLGSQSHVQASFHDPEGTGNITGLGTVRLLEAIRLLRLSPRFFNAASSEIFGNAPGPLNEESPVQPRNPYGAAKAYACQMTRIYREHHGLFAGNGILFNHESPLRNATFVSRKITQAATRIAAGRQEDLTLGNLNAHRDWGFAGDYVVGMWQLLQADSPRDYIFSTGQTHSVREFCSAVFEHVGLPLIWQGTGLEETGISQDGRILVRVDPQYFRPEGNARIFGDSTRARQDLGWQTPVQLSDLVRMMVDHDQQLLQSG